jgi:hypothetical protein
MSDYFFKAIFIHGIVSVLMCTLIGGCHQDTVASTHVPPSSIVTKNLVEQLKKRIENFDEPISYCQFMDLQIKNQINQQQADQLVDFAYAHDNPVLFRTAAKIIASERYSLNFVWLSPSMVEEQYPITGNDEERLQKNILRPLSDWQSKQPEA